MDLVSKDRNYIQLEIQERTKEIFFLGLHGGGASVSREDWQFEERVTGFLLGIIGVDGWERRSRGRKERKANG